MQSLDNSANGSLSIIQTQGTLDLAYPSLILASTARTLNKEAQIFFSYYGIRCLLKDTSSLKISPLGKPEMPVHLPFGPKFLRKFDWNKLQPDLVWALPGMNWLATKAFKKHLAQQGQLPFEDMRELCLELGVKMIACQMSMELLGFKAEDLIDEVEFAGAATYLAKTPDHQSLYI